MRARLRRVAGEFSIIAFAIPDAVFCAACTVDPTSPLAADPAASIAPETAFPASDDAIACPAEERVSPTVEAASPAAFVTVFAAFPTVSPTAVPAEPSVLAAPFAASAAFFEISSNASAGLNLKAFVPPLVKTFG